MCSPPTITRCSFRTFLISHRAPYSAHRDGRKRRSQRNCLPCTTIHHPLKRSRPRPYTIFPMPTDAGKSDSTLSGKLSEGRLAGVSGPLGPPLCAPIVAHDHHDAGRCGERKSNALAAPLGRMGIRPRFTARSIRHLRRVLHCSRHFASKQTMSSEWSSARRHRACSFVANELSSETLPKPPRCVHLRVRFFLHEDGTFWCKAFCPPLRYVMTWPFWNLRNICDSVTFMDSKNSSTTVSTNWVISASDIFELVFRCRASDKRALSSLT